MKQKIVISLPIRDDKCRAKALKVAVESKGVESAAVVGEEMVVIGDGIDSLKLAQRLKKKLGDAELTSVGVADEQPSLSFPVTEPPPVGVVAPPIYGLPHFHHYEIREPEPSCCSPCTIM